MKTLVLNLFATSLIALSASAVANEQLVNGDGSLLSDICIKAVTQPREVAPTLAKHNLSAQDISCNGKPLRTFVRSLAADSRPVKLMTAGDSPESRLCVAAATSANEYMRLKSEAFANDEIRLQRVVCNDKPLVEFARQYGNPDFRI
ncbi:MAG: hypothetical protein ACFHX7_21870 [Pseudomonadota bacterium]